MNLSEFVPPPLLVSEATGLLNRALLEPLLTRCTEEQLGLFLVQFAHAEGGARPMPPAIWREIERVLRDELAEPLLLFHYGRSLLAGLFCGAAEQRQAIERACRLIAGARWPVRLRPRLGVALRTRGRTAGELIRQADRALAEAGEGGADELAGILTGDPAADHAHVGLLASALSCALGTDDVEQVLRRIIDLLIEGTGAQRGVIMLMGAGRPAVPIARGRGGAEIAELSGHSRTVPRQVFESGEGQLLSAEAADALPDSMTRHRLQSILCVPLRAAEEPVGVLYLDSDAAATRFAEQDLAFVQALGDRLGPGLAELLARAARARNLAEENQRLKSAVEGELVACSGAMQAVLELGRKVAATDTTVLITGESGTGKERVARLVHKLSPRVDGPLVVLNCAAIPRELLESELFGHEKGAFTGATERRLGKFEQAHGGTLFLDEVGELPLELQTKLLRALQEREVERVGGAGPISVDVRILAATNQDLEALVGDGRFRDDLYFRLNVFPIELPPLRARTEEVEPLFGAFVERFSERFGRQPPTIEAGVFAALRAYHWPGNVRELENCAERALILADGGALRPEHVLLPRKPGAAGPGPTTLKENERLCILRALEQTGGNKTEAARLLGIPRSSFYNKVKEHEIESTGHGADA